jgi:two-component system response regulator CpxR
MASVLYVDDEETISHAVGRWFERRGHRVHLARSIEDAKQILAEHEPAAIFVDIWLGKESGFDLMAWIENVRPELANRVTFVTGEGTDALEHGPRGWNTRGRPVLGKPFKLTELESRALGVVDAPGESQA